LVGECLAQGWWWKESKKSNKTSMPPIIYENGTKTTVFPHVLTLKKPKTPFYT
jgi:hypothetical protein